jgi:hypothetical protein
MVALTSVDLLAVARATCSDIEWRELPVTPLVRELLTNALEDKQGTTALERLLGPDVWAQVLAISPDEQPQQTEEEVFLPPLPVAAQLSDRARKAAEQSGLFVDKFLEWAIRRSPMTPPQFLEAGVVWALALAIARRVHINVYKPVFPNLYVLWIAETSIFKKSTGMEAVADLIRRACSHMLLPQEMTPEAFILELAGRIPSNYEKLAQRQKHHVDTGRRFAAQRGIMIDEASSMLGANRKDYMQGQEELLLRGFDSSSQEYRRRTASEGLIEISDLSLCILGATTPAALTRNITSDSWETGQMARYALLYPDKRLAYELPDLTPDEFRPPTELVFRLQELHNELPPPPPLENLSGEDIPHRESVSALIQSDAHKAYRAYTKAVTYDMLTDSLDRRLQPNYARLAELCLKVALSLAAIDWADHDHKGSPVITLGVWARAQQIVEGWRLSLHRLMKAMDTGEDARTETRVLEHLTRYPDGETLRDLTRRTGLKRVAIQDALKSLMESGLVVTGARKSTRGPEALIYVAK